MARRKSNKPYKGVLTTRSWKPDPTKSPEENWLDYKPVAEQKMNALFEHFGISQDRPGKWQLLAYALAHTYVPGFAPSLKKVGKKATLDQAVTDFILFCDLALAEKLDQSVKARAHFLTSKGGPWPLFRGKNPDTIRDRYSNLLKNPQSKEHKRMLNALTIVSNPDFKIPKDSSAPVWGMISQIRAKIAQR